MFFCWVFKIRVESPYLRLKQKSDQKNGVRSQNALYIRGPV